MRKNVWSVCFVYIATIIGAGFATGQEISSYFVSCGAKGFFGIIIAAILIGVCCYSVLFRVYNDCICSFDAYLSRIMPGFCSNIVDKIVSLFLLCGFCVMVSAFGTALEEHYGLSKFICCIVLCILCFFVFLRPIKLLVQVNGILAPIMIVGIFIAGICVIFMRERVVSVFLPSNATISKNSFGFLWLSILYVSYNTLFASVILVSMKSFVRQKSDAVKISILSSGILLILLEIIFSIIKIYDNKIFLGQIPMLTIMARIGQNAKNLYALILLFAIFTTAVGNGYGFIERYKGNSLKNRVGITFLMCITALFLSMISFENLVQYLYGGFGICGIYLLICIITDGVCLTFFKNNENSQKTRKKGE